jgi:hypothetical protein
MSKNAGLSGKMAPRNGVEPFFTHRKCVVLPIDEWGVIRSRAKEESDTPFTLCEPHSATELLALLEDGG